MKSHQGGIHQPGLHPAGETEPSREEFAAFKARVEEWVAALSAQVRTAAAGGGKLFRTLVVPGADASGGDVALGSDGALEEDGLTLEGWTIVSIARWQITDGISGVHNHGWLGGFNIFHNPVGSNGQLTFREGNDYTAYVYLVLLQSPGPSTSPGDGGDLAALSAQINDVAADLAEKWATLLSTDVGKGADLIGFSGMNRMWYSIAPNVAAAANDANVAAHNAQAAIDFLGLSNAGIANDTDSTIDTSIASLRYTMTPLTADRTVTLDPTGAQPLEMLTIIRRHPPETPTDAFSLIIVNGGPGGGTLATLAGDLPRIAEFRLNAAGTDWELLRQGRLAY